MSEIPSAPSPPPGVGLPGYSTPPPVPGRAPRPVRTAVALVWVLLGLALVGLVVSFAEQTGGAPEGSVADPDGLSPEDTAALHGFTLVVITLFVLAYCALLAVMALQLRAGRTWPRTALIVIAALSAVGTALTLGVEVLVRAGPRFDGLETGTAELLVSCGLRVVGLAVFAAAVVMLFRPASRAWLGAWREVRSDAARRRVAW